MSLLDAIKNNKSQLKATTTRVRTSTGAIYEEKRTGDAGFSRTFKGTEALPAFLQEGEKGFSVLDSWQFAESAWKQIKAESGEQSAPLPKSLSVVSFNVWFKEWYLAERALALFDIVRAQSADVICLQEVTKPFLKLLLAQSWVRSDYFLSDASGTTCYPYGVLMLSSRKLGAVPKFTLHALPSNMGRRLLIGEFRFASKTAASAAESKSAGAGAAGAAASAATTTVRVATVHLESMANTEMRVQQLELILPLIDKEACTHAVFCGDFNFDDGREENKTLAAKPQFVDLWTKLRPKERGSSGFEGMGRFDRVLLRSEAFAGKSILQLGTKPIEVKAAASATTAESKAAGAGAGAAAAAPAKSASAAAAADPVYPSDHYGLCAVATLSG